MLIIPSTVKWIKGLIVAQYAIFGIIIFISLCYIFAEPVGGFWDGVGIFMERQGMKRNEDTAYNIGAIFGRYVLPIAALSFMMRGVLRRRKTMFLIALVVSALFAFGLHALPVFQLIIFILAMQQSAKDYFKGVRVVEFDSI